MTKIVLITGGSGGIGRATSLELSRLGYLVCINYLKDKVSAENLVNLITKDGGNAVSIQADISEEKEVLNLFKKIDKLDGILYGLINNAGVLGEKSSFVEMNLERVTKTFAINVFGTFLCCKEAIKRMSTKYSGKGGCIVNISSGAVKTGSPNEYIDYASSKGAIDVMTLGLSKELALEEIRVNAIRPGFINTEIHSIPNRMEEVKLKIPMGRVGTPEEIANVITWLISDKSSYTTGAIIDVSGGK